MAEFSKQLERLEAIVRTLEAEDLDLDEALKLFEEGVERLRVAREQLAQAELKVKKVLEIETPTSSSPPPPPAPPGDRSPPGGRPHPRGRGAQDVGEPRRSRRRVQPPRGREAAAAAARGRGGWTPVRRVG